MVFKQFQSNKIFVNKYQIVLAVLQFCIITWQNNKKLVWGVCLAICQLRW